MGNVQSAPSAIGSRSGLIAYDSLASAIVARNLQTELAVAEWVHWDEPPSRAARRLARLGFDQAPVERGGTVVGYVARLELARTAAPIVGPDVHLIGPDTVTSSTASVREVMDALLPSSPLTFVVDGHRISGFITPSDLNKHPARAHFYLLLADLEIALAGAVRMEYAGRLDDALAHLHPASQGAIRKRFRMDSQNRLETDVIAGMSLGHLIRIVGRSGRLFEAFGAPDERTWEDWTAGFPALRDAVMHPTLEFLGASRSLDVLVSAEQRIRVLLEAP